MAEGIGTPLDVGIDEKKSDSREPCHHGLDCRMLRRILAGRGRPVDLEHVSLPAAHPGVEGLQDKINWQLYNLFVKVANGSDKGLVTLAKLKIGDLLREESAQSQLQMFFPHPLSPLRAFLLIMENGWLSFDEARKLTGLELGTLGPEGLEEVAEFWPRGELLNPDSVRKHNLNNIKVLERLGLPPLSKEVREELLRAVLGAVPGSRPLYRDTLEHLARHYWSDIHLGDFYKRRIAGDLKFSGTFARRNLDFLWNFCLEDMLREDQDMLVEAVKALTVGGKGWLEHNHPETYQGLNQLCQSTTLTSRIDFGNWTLLKDCLDSSLSIDDLREVLNRQSAQDRGALCQSLLDLLVSTDGGLEELEINCELCGERIFEKGPQEVLRTVCGHLFHDDCLAEHLEESDSCPIDGRPLRLNLT
jgi:hypothetical protein